jgi:cytochrome c oxidase subunit 1
MQEYKRQILKEIGWFILAGLGSLLMGRFLFGLSLSNSTLDIHLHDTYFVIDNAYLIVPFFIFFLFIIYSIRTFKNRFSISIANWTMLLSGILTISGLTILSRLFYQLSFAGLTLYPPLSQLGPDKFSELKPNHLFELATKILLIIQILVLTVLLYLTYSWGQLKSKKA